MSGSLVMVLKGNKWDTQVVKWRESYKRTVYTEVCIGLGGPAKDAEATSISRCEEARKESRVNEPLESLATGESYLTGAGDYGRGMQPLLKW